MLLKTFQNAVKHSRIFFWIALVLTLGLDQVTKQLFAGMVNSRQLIPGILNLISREPNPRGAFSMGPDHVVFYVVATCIGLGLIWWFFITTSPKHTVPLLGLGLLAGGAIGNLIDRLAIGAVRDFIDLHWFNKAHWPTFNVADMGICAGVVLLVWYAFRADPCANR